MAIRITVTHVGDTGRTDDWKATAEGLRPGIGKRWGEAIEGLVRANLEAFGIVALTTEDPFNPDNPLTTWKSQGRIVGG